jgi:hypothetical protein
MLSQTWSVSVQNVVTARKSDSQLFFDFDEIAISAAGERDLERPLSL